MSKKTTVIKNTIYMFLRMFFVMFLTLFSTRLLLKTLGFEGYGIYDLIFGVVILFNILSGSMATTLQRFYNMSQNDIYKQSSIYSVSLQIFFLISLLILILGFSLSNTIVGFLNIPIYHIQDAVIFFNLCVLNLVFMIVRLPFVALLISNEKMGEYALVSVFDAVLKFLGVLLLSYISINISSLIIYGWILSLVTLIVTLAYIIICYTRLEMPKFRRKINKNYYKEILSFSGWTLFGSSASLFSQQGLSLILNNFFGVLINAANGVAQQIYTAVYQFVNSFQTAYSPYLMKTYAQDDFETLKKLIIFFSKFSVFLYLLIAVPLFTFAEFILKLWLGSVPEYAVLFTRLTLVVVLFEVLSAPLWLTVQASGNIQRYQVIISIILVLNLPLAYFCFYVWHQPIFAFLAKIFTSVLAYAYRVRSVQYLNCLNIKEYFIGFFSRLFLLLLIISPIIYLHIDQINESVLSIFLDGLLIVFFLIIMSFFILLNRSENKELFRFISKFFKRSKL
ncbi:oligosaccharide flippase family protein [Acinetobacter vivianii]|uniref:oligosaccharide flippase family protein n=1 Tax=Acinetobacter vivianii TaxID=1776742 RepID=UPI002DBEC7C5|nr:oligosaccharide flippase family protein [Acinetobacter vivianii]MEB6481023.1 oligosaccharide flippase family protein [Acinetobacter vivianii]MEB6659307.1 oligosaccharide flippase family protein [Acinetobacter vivianii]